jgi:hypothetical protein
VKLGGAAIGKLGTVGEAFTAKTTTLRFAGKVRLATVFALLTVNE